MDVDYKKLNFKKPKARAVYMARHNLVNRMLNMFGNNEQIPGFRLMEMMDDSLECLSSDFAKSEMKGLQSKLVTILPNITHAFISQSSNDEAPKTFDDAKNDNDQADVQCAENT